MRSGATGRAPAIWASLLGASLSFGCAARGHLATPDEMALLRQTEGMSASGKITLRGPGGTFSTRLLFGVAKPDFLRLEIPAGAGLRFLLVARSGRLRADLPQDDAMFEGPATSAVMDSLFGIDLDPKDLVNAILGAPPQTFKAGWRFDRALPTQVVLEGAGERRLSLTLDDPELRTPRLEAFDFGPPRARSWSLGEMSERLGLKR